MTNDLSFYHLIINASPVVQLVMAILALASITSWTMIFDRIRILRRARDDADEFEQRFWSGTDVTALYREIDQRENQYRGLSAIFRAGFREFTRQRQSHRIDTSAILQATQRSMRVAMNREIEQLENHLPFLATVGSTSPYIGLFGTVWGIMHSFHALGSVKQATLALVAPGIAEALIATAIGLFAAIPAVIAYNRFASASDRLANRYDDFVEEFSTILQRQAHG